MCEWRAWEGTYAGSRSSKRYENKGKLRPYHGVRVPDEREFDFVRLRLRPARAGDEVDLLDIALVRVREAAHAQAQPVAARREKVNDFNV